MVLAIARMRLTFAGDHTIAEAVKVARIVEMQLPRGCIHDLKGRGLGDCGGNSSPGARPMRAQCVRSIRAQCEISDTALFFMQWGGVNKKLHGRSLGG